MLLVVQDVWVAWQCLTHPGLSSNLWIPIIITIYHVEWKAPEGADGLALAGRQVELTRLVFCSLLALTSQCP